MQIVLSILRIITAIVLPVAAVSLSILTLFNVRKAQGGPPEADQTCIRCQKNQTGDEAKFHYAEAVGNARERAAKKKLLPTDTPLLGSESHFVCDSCAKRYLWYEIAQIIIMSLLYPLYLYVIIPLFAQNGLFANFLIETLLMVLSVAGTTSAFDMFKATRIGQMPLSEARDRVAILVRRKKLGKKLSYYSRLGHNQLKK